MTPGIHERAQSWGQRDERTNHEVEHELNATPGLEEPGVNASESSHWQWWQEDCEDEQKAVVPVVTGRWG